MYIYACKCKCKCKCLCKCISVLKFGRLSNLFNPVFEFNGFVNLFRQIVPGRNFESFTWHNNVLLWPRLSEGELVPPNVVSCGITTSAPYNTLAI